VASLFKKHNQLKKHNKHAEMELCKPGNMGTALTRGPLRKASGHGLGFYEKGVGREKTTRLGRGV